LNEPWNEAYHGVMSLNDYNLPLQCEPPLSFDMTCDEYIKIFDKLMSTTSYAFNLFEK